MGGGSVERTAVLDTGPAIHLDQIGSLDLLDVFDTVVIPQAVYEELSAGGVPGRLERHDYEIREERTDAYESLDEGESSALAISSGTDDAVLLTDDLDARKTAGENGVDVHGSIGVIALGFFQGRITFDEAVSRMRGLQEKSALFVTDEVVERGVQALKDARHSG